MNPWRIASAAMLSFCAIAFSLDDGMTWTQKLILVPLLVGLAASDAR